MSHKSIEPLWKEITNILFLKCFTRVRKIRREIYKQARGFLPEWKAKRKKIKLQNFITYYQNQTFRINVSLNVIVSQTWIRLYTPCHLYIKVSSNSPFKVTKSLSILTHSRVCLFFDKTFIPKEHMLISGVEHKLFWLQQ